MISNPDVFDIEIEGISVFKKIKIHEKINEPYYLYFYIPYEENILEKLNKKINIKIKGENQNLNITINCIVFEIKSYLDPHYKENIMEVLAVHPLYLMQLKRKYRIFSAPQFPKTKDCIKKIFSEYSINLKLNTYCLDEPRDFFVQYNETDLNFVKRKLYMMGVVLKAEYDGSVTACKLETIQSKKYTRKDLIPSFLSEKKQKKSLANSLFSYNPENPNLDLFIKGDNQKINQKYVYRDDYLDKATGQELVNFCNQIYPSSKLEIISQKWIQILDKIQLENSILYVQSLDHFFKFEPNSFLKINASDGINYDFQQPKTHPHRALVKNPDGKEAVVDSKGRVFIILLFDEDKQKIPVLLPQSFFNNDSNNFRILRENEEVIINFLDNNPDFIFIQGSIPNGQNKWETSAFQSGYSISTQNASHRKTSLMIDVTEEKKELEKKNTPYDYEWTIGKNCIVNLTTEDNKGDFLFKQNEGDFSHEQNKGNYTISIQEGNKSTIIKKGNKMISLKEGDLEIELKNGNISIKSDSKNISLEAVNIEIKAKEKISIEAAEINIQAKSKMEFNSKGPLNVKGMIIEIKPEVSCSIITNIFELTAEAAISLMSSAALLINAGAAVNISAGGAFAVNAGAPPSISGGGLTALMI